MNGKIKTPRKQLFFSITRNRLEKDFGVSVSGVDIGAIEIDKSSDGYARLMAVTRDLSAETARAKTEAEIKQIHDKQRIEAKNYEETLRIQREEAQYAQRKQTQTSNFAAYQTEAQTQVGVAGAEALGKMGAGSAGSVSIGGAGFNPAAMVAGMTLGGAVGQNLAGSLNGILKGAHLSPGAVPPPIPVISYHVAVNGKATGPYDVITLKNMVASGQITSESLVWTNGMKQWEQAGTIEDLKNLFIDMPPIPSP